MIRNYLKIAWRNLVKSKGFSAINIVGLGIGLSAFILIALYVADELSYDRFNKNAHRIYRINSDILFGGTEMKLAVSADPMGAVLKQDYPEVEEYTRIFANGNKLVRKGADFINEDRVAHVDSTFFNVFTLPAIAGDTKTALNEPNTVVITESTAKRYFGTAQAVGKTIETNDNTSTLYKVTAVIKNVPANSHFDFDFFFSMDNVQYGFGNFLSHNFYTYLLLRPGADYKAFNRHFDDVINKYVLPQAKQFMNIKSMDEFRKAGNKLNYELMPLTDIHLRSARVPEMRANGNIQYIYIFSAVALFVLLIACINFVNLSTARSSNRAKEVGIRKVLGTAKKSLIGQFLTESILTVMLSMGIAILIVYLALGYFNSISGKELLISDLFQSKYILILLLLPVLVGTLAGIYPAFFLSSFKPVTVLKGKFTGTSRKSVFRNVLVIFQFATSIILIIGTIVVYQQLRFIQNKQLGFNKDQVLVINNTYALGDKVIAFKDEVAQMSGVSAASFAGYLPVGGSARTDFTFSKEAVMDPKNGLNMQAWGIDYDYIKLLQMKIVAGRDFSREYGTDSSAIVINQTASRMLGFDGNAVGKKLYSNFESNNSGLHQVVYTIIGVVEDFNYESLRKKIDPICFRLSDNKWAAAFKISTSNITGLINNIRERWKPIANGVPFSYQFLDDAFDNMYKQEQRAGSVALSFSVLAILIACLGLFGLAAYMSEKRMKEIGVRKVLGASVLNIITMLSGDFLRLVLISSVVAMPLAWFAMHRWLEDFAFRISMGWWMFIAAGVLAMLIAILTVSSQAFRAAIINPVKSLRTE